MEDWLQDLKNFKPPADEDWEPIYVTPWTGKKHTEESKKAIGDGNRGKVRTEELKRHLSEVLKGRKLTEEWLKNRTDSYCSKHLYTITKSGNKEVVNNLHTWCKENNLPRTSVYRHVKDGTSYKGYTFSKELVK